MSTLPPELSESARALVFDLDRAAWWSACEAPRRRRAGLAVLRQVEAQLRHPDPTLPPEWRDAAPAAISEARQAARDAAARRRGGMPRFGGSLVAAFLGAWGLSALMTLAWSAMEPDEAWVLALGKSWSEERVGAFIARMSEGDEALGALARRDQEREPEPPPVLPEPADRSDSETAEAEAAEVAEAAEAAEAEVEGEGEAEADAEALGDDDEVDGLGEDPDAEEVGSQEEDGGAPPSAEPPPGEFDPFDADARMASVSGRMNTEPGDPEPGEESVAAPSGSPLLIVAVRPPPGALTLPSDQVGQLGPDGLPLGSGGVADAVGPDGLAPTAGAAGRGGRTGTVSGVAGGIEGGGARAYVARGRKAPMAFRAVGHDEDRVRRNTGEAGPLWVGETEVTQLQFYELMGMDLNAIAGQWDHPAHLVSWCGAVGYANVLSEREGFQPAYTVPDDCEEGGAVAWDTHADGFRLLTEAEWEALALVTASEGELVRYMQTNNTGMAPVRFAGFAEAHGLMGMRGNVGEWVWGHLPPASPDARYQQSMAGERRAVGRSCLQLDGKVAIHPKLGTTRPCRLQGEGHERHFGLGFRLARGESTVFDEP